MGLLDFWKRRPPLPEPAATLEGLLAQAAADPAFRPEFYRRLLLEPLLVLTGDDPATLTPGRWVADGTQTMQVRAWADGRIPVFTSPPRLFDGGVLTTSVGYAELKGRSLLEMLPGKTLLLNPYSDFGKELLPEEVARILAGTVLDVGRTLTVQQPTRVLLGEPAVPPTALTQALARLLHQQPRVRAAYLAWLHDPASSDPPHYLICLDVEGELRAIAQQVGYTAQQFLPPGELLDIVQAGQSSLTDYFRHATPFYQR